MSDDAAGGGGGDIARQDEVLELLYWLEGERLAGSATRTGMTRLLAHPEAAVRDTLDRLVRRGDVVATGGPETEYRLTENGRREAARRFQAEFGALLNQGHGECSDPECDCHTNPEAAAECHAARAHGGHGH